MSGVRIPEPLPTFFCICLFGSNEPEWPTARPFTVAVLQLMKSPSFSDQSNSFLAVACQRITELTGVVCPDGGKIGLLVGLSGGPDSVALLLGAQFWAQETGNRVEAAHLNHALRGGDSDEDALFCRELCHNLGINLHERREDPRPTARLRGKGQEEAGRHIRYRFFGDLMTENPHLQVLATGHHEDDQSETVVMRLFRGTGLDGLRGILPVTGHTIRPLLTVSRQHILAFLENAGQPWRLDHTNENGDNVRARFRRELMPLVRDIFGQGSDRTPARLASTLAADVDLLYSLTTENLNRISVSGVNGTSLTIAELLEMPAGLARRVLRSWLESKNVPELELVHLNAVLKWLTGGQSGSRLDLPGGAQLEWNFETLDISDISIDTPMLSAADLRVLVALAHDGKGSDPTISDGPNPPWQLVCPAEILQGNIRVRNVQPGDLMVPFGMQGTKKLSDLLREAHIPRAKRGEILVVEDGQGILWVIGLARAERTRLLPSTARMVTISVIERSS